ncbi:MAG: TetR/AcrR family transcriptional regulator [Corynebacteriales bacterium]|nr:TetR/AcrR family transcriptional regulator [Mycobacteriales bacterium]
MSDSSPANTRLPRGERRTQLLHAARAVFVERGYHAAAMDEIAERAGVSKPVLYQHFPGKLELYVALVDEQADSLVRRVREAIESSEDNKTRVFNTLAAYFDFVDAEGEAFRLIFESDLRSEPAARDRVERAYRECTNVICENISASTGANRAQAELLAVGLAGAAELGARHWLEQRRNVPKREAVELLAALTWRGISNFPIQDS